FVFQVELFHQEGGDARGFVRAGAEGHFGFEADDVRGSRGRVDPGGTDGQFGGDCHGSLPFAPAAVPVFPWALAPTQNDAGIQSFPGGAARLVVGEGGEDRQPGRGGFLFRAEGAPLDQVVLVEFGRFGRGGDA